MDTFAKLDLKRFSIATSRKSIEHALGNLSLHSPTSISSPRRSHELSRLQRADMKEDDIASNSILADHTSQAELNAGWESLSGEYRQVFGKARDKAPSSNSLSFDGETAQAASIPFHTYTESNRARTSKSQVSPTPTRSSIAGHDSKSVPEMGNAMGISNQIQLRLSHMLDGYYMTSWKDTLMEWEVRDDYIRNEYSEENDSSDLIDQEKLYMYIDSKLPSFSCELNRALSMFSNSAVSDIVRKMLIIFPGLIDYMVTAEASPRKGLFKFLKSFIAFDDTRPLFLNGNGRDSLILEDYASLVADFLLKCSEQDLLMYRRLIDQIAQVNGMRFGATSRTLVSKRTSSSHFDILSQIMDRNATATGSVRCLQDPPLLQPSAQSAFTQLFSPIPINPSTDEYTAVNIPGELGSSAPSPEHLSNNATPCQLSEGEGPLSLEMPGQVELEDENVAEQHLG